MPQLSLHTPIADITLYEHQEKIVALDWGWVEDQEKSPLLLEAKNQLDAYFDGQLTSFDLPLDPYGTDHQKRVWTRMASIQYGETMSYGALAKNLSSSAQAVGTACGRNPIPIILPCHRVVATGEKGSEKWLGGYSGDGGIWTKKALLILEEILEPELF
ncbi:methylated-DNA--[protein]-cysteine S-methyltransferase [Temperatibacter marinus]|uniref:Methylated-DNA--[protein]-cysteine S-methyltransferase n=1 Tax=Temperatibacter marinus TaxID=1456591 RepID=A0AA52EKG8_9PROT|nr:methylated-DNA--[protein]-cysteine S-methyltransferase [Temperatibacter marinus]WND03671.1 methylated-DNA--[protein]-cysteine S-methyltransferase [Temperatibacter marinus]